MQLSNMKVTSKVKIPTKLVKPTGEVGVKMLISLCQTNKEQNNVLLRLEKMRAYTCIKEHNITEPAY